MIKPAKYLQQWLLKNTNESHYLFALQDLRGLFPDMKNHAFKAFISRFAANGELTRVCRGIYAYEPAMPHDGLFLFRVAALLRCNEFNYVSLETVLSDAGVISQIPINVIFIMSSGRSNRFSCGRFGAIEFVHTAQRPNDLIDELSYDRERGMWYASVAQAVRDAKATRRSLDLIDWEIADELI